MINSGYKLLKITSTKSCWIIGTVEIFINRRMKTRTFKNTNLSPMTMATLPLLHTLIVSVQSHWFYPQWSSCYYIHEKFSDKEITVCRVVPSNLSKQGIIPEPVGIDLSCKVRTFSCLVRDEHFLVRWCDLNGSVRGRVSSSR